MKKKSLITINSLSDRELDNLISVAIDVKAHREKYSEALKGKNLALFFEKPSTRTRVSFEVGINQLGGNSFDLSPNSLQPGKRESLKDIAQTLSRYLDCLVLRTFKHESILEVDKYCSIPVINGLSDYSHPCQALADYLTIYEHVPNVKECKVVYVGDGNNVVHSLMILLARKGVHLTVSTPEKHGPRPDVIDKAKEICERNGSILEFVHDPKVAVKGADIVYTDVWISMGEEESGKDSSVFVPYQINSELLSYAKQTVKVMHCLPAYRGKEITDEVMDSERSIVFDQAENRLHVQKAALLHLLS
jgi:ornithine carbamoyltransferase